MQNQDHDKIVFVSFILNKTLQELDQTAMF